MRTRGEGDGGGARAGACGQYKDGGAVRAGDEGVGDGGDERRQRPKSAKIQPFPLIYS